MKILFTCCIAIMGFAVQAQTYDLIILNGKLVDGSGNPWYYADVAIQNGKVVRVGNLKDVTSKR